MRLAWATDIHLDFLERTQIKAFAAELAATEADAIVVTGDITIAPRLTSDLLLLEEIVARPVYFVLGNHDFYRGSIASAHIQAKTLTRESHHLRWLPERGVVELTPTVALVGCDGWGDARLGNVTGTPVRLNDFVLIEDLCGLGRPALTAMLRALGDGEAKLARALLRDALAAYKHVLFATHVPPFRASCWHEGKTPAEDDDWLPYFTCKAVGDALQHAAAAHTARRITVLCGHTHGHGSAIIRSNLEVHTAAAEYGCPRVARVFDL